MAKSKKTPNDILSEVRRHFDDAKSELETRIMHRTQGFNEYDKAYRSYINDSQWPFNASVFVPLTFTSIFSKGTRLISNKVKGRLIASQFGNELGARIGTELLSAQYEDHDDFYEEPMVSKWLKMDQNARKYGASFGLCQWRRELNNEGKVIFDGPTFEPLDNRKVYLQPGTYSITESDYVIVEREMTLRSMKNANEAAKSRDEDPYYKNLDILEKASKSKRTDFNSNSVNKDLRGLSETDSSVGDSRRFRVLTEYRRDTWITWVPDVGSDQEMAGTVIRVLKNPHKHSQIPIIRLVYMPIDDDIYGVSEMEAGLAIQKATNALVSGAIDAVSTELFPILKGSTNNVRWETIDWTPRAVWKMTNPSTDLIPFQSDNSFMNAFAEVYRILQASFAQAMGDTVSDGGSQLAQLGSNDKTATEIKDLALLRGSRDNLNKLFLSESIKKMYSFWWTMDQQYLTDDKVIKLVGRDALQFFIDAGLTGYKLEDDGYRMIAAFMDENMGITFQKAYELLEQEGALQPYMIPLYPSAEKTQPKLQIEENGRSGFLTVNPKDLMGQYRFTVDLNTVGTPNDLQEATAMNQFVELVTKNVQALAQEGYKPKMKELLETIAEKQKIHNADMFFERVQDAPQPQQQQLPVGQLPFNIQEGTNINEQQFNQGPGNGLQSGNQAIPQL